MSSYYIVTMPHVFKQFHFLIGVTGSVGGEAEKQYVQATYGAGVFSVPPFLLTCADARKEDPALIAMEFYDEESSQLAHVKELAMTKSQRVPVLIITGSPQDAQRVRAAFCSMKGRAADTQLFVEVVNGQSLEDKWAGIVDTATRPHASGSGWNITVTDYFGGRGHDYKVDDEDVDEAGGMLVIMMQVPDSKREWVQWRGRTARQDRRGQLALILHRNDSFLAEHGGLVDAFLNGELTSAKLQERLLDERNAGAQRKLETYGEQQQRSMAVNELCDRFYAAVGGTGTDWPSTEGHRKLREYLHKNGSSPLIRDTVAMANELGVGGSFPYA